ncbi:hypothetical protein CW304_08985 [Bacillus sp. UFRGS-B20]|nr:hypothetical protein CW304_08985 [Bacillus sp. UFRGS-B20]
MNCLNHSTPFASAPLLINNPLSVPSTNLHQRYLVVLQQVNIYQTYPSKDACALTIKIPSFLTDLQALNIASAVFILSIISYLRITFAFAFGAIPIFPTSLSSEDTIPSTDVP